MKAYGATDIGLHRAENQDCFSISEQGPFTICAVCDGMGGATAGGTASTLALHTFVETLASLLREDATAEQVREMASYSVAQANRAVFDRAQQDEACCGMGTTLVCAVCRGDEAVICNVGDSRAYRFCGDTLTQISHDHSVVEAMVEQGNITLEQARRHPHRNLITRALGPESTICCDTYEVTVKKEELLLLCSDGLVVTVSDEELLRVLRKKTTCAEQVSELIALSMANGAPDNVTVVLVENR